MIPNRPPTPPTQPLPHAGGDTAPPPYNMTGGSSAPVSETAGAGRSSVTASRLFDNRFAAFESGYWSGQYGYSPYFKIAPVFQEMREQEPVKGQPMYDWKNSVFGVLPVDYIPTLIQALEIVKAAEIKRLAGDASSRITGMGIQIGDPKMTETTVVFGNELAEYGMYLAVRVTRNNVITDVLYDLTGPDVNVYDVRTQYDHETGRFSNVTIGPIIPRGIQLVEDFLRYAYQSMLMPFANTPAAGRQQAGGTPLSAPRTSAIGGHGSPPTTHINPHETINLMD
jgi:hypothetical protein